jgi:hypothetical protein
MTLSTMLDGRYIPGGSMRQWVADGEGRVVAMFIEASAPACRLSPFSKVSIAGAASCLD